MSQERRTYPARSVQALKCPHCHGIQLVCGVSDHVEVVVHLDPDQWAAMLMADPEFRREVAKIFGERP